MHTLIVSTSRSPHGNTRRVADALAATLHAEVITPAEATADVLAGADRVGFGSGIYYLGFDRALVDRVRRLPDLSGRDAFVFATSGLPEPPFRRYTTQFATLLERRGFRVVGTFVCRGLDTWGPFRLVGGVNRGRPGDDDVARAEQFAAQLG